MVKSENGFTLIEMMVVVTIIGILAAIAYPSYQEYIRRTKRVEMQSSMLQIASQIQKYKIANFTLVGASQADLGLATTYPLQGTALYTVSLTPVDGSGNMTSNVWTLIATPVTGASQQVDGSIYLNSRAQKCWDKGASTCVLSETSKWDNK